MTKLAEVVSREMLRLASPTHHPPQASIEAWTERRCLEAVLRILDEEPTE